MNTKFADYATTTAVDTKLADYAKSDSVYSKAAADTAFAKAGDVDTLKTTVGDTDGGLVKDVKDLQRARQITRLRWPVTALLTRIRKPKSMEDR